MRWLDSEHPHNTSGQWAPAQSINISSHFGNLGQLFCCPLVLVWLCKLVGVPVCFSVVRSGDVLCGNTCPTVCFFYHLLHNTETPFISLDRWLSPNMEFRWLCLFFWFKSVCGCETWLYLFKVMRKNFLMMQSRGRLMYLPFFDNFTLSAHISIGLPCIGFCWYFLKCPTWPYFTKTHNHIEHFNQAIVLSAVSLYCKYLPVMFCAAEISTCILFALFLNSRFRCILV